MKSSIKYTGEFCPKCGGRLSYQGQKIVCENNYGKDYERRNLACDFMLYTNYYGHSVTKKELTELLHNGRTDIVDFKSKTSQFKGLLRLTDNSVKMVPYNPCGFTCPQCGSEMVRTRSGYTCSKHILGDDSCQFYIPGTVAERKITEKEAKDITEGKLIILDDLHDEKGSLYSTILKMNQNFKVRPTQKICKCPACTGYITISPHTYCCTGAMHNDKGNCQFVIGRNIEGYDLAIKDIIDLCMTGSTSFFVNSKGQKRRVLIDENMKPYIY